MTTILEKTEAPPEIYFDTFEEWLKWAARQDEWTELVDGKVIFVHRNTRGEYMGVKIIHQLLIGFIYEVIRAERDHTVLRLILSIFYLANIKSL